MARGAKHSQKNTSGQDTEKRRGRTRLDLAEPELISRGACIKTHAYKFISRPQGQSELYVYDSDPHEIHNRYGETSVAAMQAAAEQRLLHWYINTTGISPGTAISVHFPLANLSHGLLANRKALQLVVAQLP